MNEPTERPDTAPPKPSSQPQEADIDSSALFAGRSEIRIVHRNAVYRLRITRTGKLILNK